MKQTCTIFSILIIGVSCIQPAHPHSGGTDSTGCHENSKTGDRHCHNTGSRSSSRSSQNLSGGKSSYYSVPLKTLKEVSGLSQEEYSSSDECKKFNFTELMKQASTGRIYLRCGKVILSIKAHKREE